MLIIKENISGNQYLSGETPRVAVHNNGHSKSNVGLCGVYGIALPIAVKLESLRGLPHGGATRSMESSGDWSQGSAEIGKYDMVFGNPVNGEPSINTVYYKTGTKFAWKIKPN